MTTPTPCYLERLTVEGLWGDRDLTVSFFADINILIGPNASGKTTILNILRFVLTPDPLALNELEFTSILVNLRTFGQNNTRTIRVTKSPDALVFKVSQQTFQFDLLDTSLSQRIVRSRIRFRQELAELTSALNGLVPAAWLPVSRRLPIPDDMDSESRALFHAEARQQRHLESVDHRLRELTSDLAKYRLKLDASLALEYKKFERKVLEIILYNKSHDQLSVIAVEGGAPQDDEKDLLIRSFKEAGLIDSRIQARIDEHFRVAQEVVARLAKDPSKFAVDDIAILPLIPRTRAMIEAARQLESARESIFAPLKNFERIVNRFLAHKAVSVLDGGELAIRMNKQAAESIAPEKLSSGEKQLLILLTQALLRADEPDVYVADEPELSLHVIWQAQLLKSLVDLGGQIQIIVATHSPDIVGSYHDKVIDLSKIG